MGTDKTIITVDNIDCNGVHCGRLTYIMEECEPPYTAYEGDINKLSRRLQMFNYHYKRNFLKDKKLLEDELNQMIIAKLSW